LYLGELSWACWGRKYTFSLPLQAVPYCTSGAPVVLNNLSAWTYNRQSVALTVRQTNLVNIFKYF
jgi:hypothetical protein